MSDSLWSYGLQNTRIPCPSPSPRVCLTSCTLSWRCHPTISSSGSAFSSCPQSSSIRDFYSELALCIRCPKYWSFSLSISPSNEYLSLISFRADQFDLLVVQVTLMGLLQHNNLKASILWCSAFFMVQLSHLYMTTIHDYWENHGFDIYILYLEQIYMACLPCLLPAFPG